MITQYCRQIDEIRRENGEYEDPLRFPTEDVPVPYEANQGLCGEDPCFNPEHIVVESHSNNDKRRGPCGSGYLKMCC